MSKLSHEAVRRALIAAACEMNVVGLNQGRSGNVSQRVRNGLLITPRALAYETMEPADIVFVAADGSVRGRHSPSTELPFHRAIFAARPEIHAVLHAHPVHATALATLRRAIPAFHYMVAVAGGDSIRVAPYATFGSETLSLHAVAALEGRRACLLANHGLIAVGADIGEAFRIAREVEALSAMYLAALAVGEPVVLSAEEMADVLTRFAQYG